MRHSELLLDKISEKNIYGVEIDGYASFPIKNLKEIGILLKLDNNEIDFDVLDACIMYLSLNVKVILEVPYEIDYDLNKLVLESIATGFDISLLPPKVKNKDNWEKYKERLTLATKLWIEQPVSQQMVYPCSGYLAYVITEVFGYKPDTITNDPYIYDNFVKAMPLDIMDNIKDGLKTVIYSSFGGKDKLEAFAHSTIYAVLNEYKDAENAEELGLEIEMSSND